MIAWLRCWYRNRHNPVRHPLGGFKCGDCGEAGADLDAMGFYGDGYVSPIRRVFSRDGQELTRTPHWTPEVKPAPRAVA